MGTHQQQKTGFVGSKIIDLVMKYFGYIVFLFLFLSHCFSVNAQNASSLLWKVSDNGLKYPSYIFGTIHLSCKEDYHLSTQVVNALQNAEAFYTEINLENTAIWSTMHKAMTSELPLIKRISHEEYERLRILFTQKLNLNIEDFNYKSLPFLLSLITENSLDCPQGYLSYETELSTIANQHQLHLGGLESIEEQLDILDKSTTAKMIIQSLESTDKDEYQKLITLYKQENIDAIEQLMDTYDETTKSILLVQRNTHWVALMIEIFKQHRSTFFAIGAAHLGGETGVLELLRAQGYKVEPVFE